MIDPSSARPPVLVVGMHRSGTSLVTRLLRDLGLFVGADTDANAEARFFQALDRTLLRELGGDWHRPATPRELLEHEPIRRLAAGRMRGRLRGIRVVRYLGWRRFVRLRLGGTFTEPWGWKDPRATFTLPVWAELFADLRLVHVVRHGVDAAASLLRRSERRMREFEEDFTRAPEGDSGKGSVQRSGDWISESLYCRSLERGFSLWRTYAAEGRRWTERLGDRSLEIRFEELAADPRPVAEGLRTFADLPPVPADRMDEIAEGVRASRALAYREDEELRRFARERSEALAEFGYEDP